MRQRTSSTASLTGRGPAELASWVTVSFSLVAMPAKLCEREVKDAFEMLRMAREMD